MIAQQVLLDDGVIVIAEARCHGAPPRASAEEVVRATEVVFPLGGIFVRTVRHAGSPAAARTSIGDPARALIFRGDEPYRISHPVGDGDRSLIVGLADPDATFPLTVVAPADDVPVSVHDTLAARRLARGLRAGALDPLAAAEGAMAVVAGIGRQPAVAGAPPRARDRRVAAAARLEVAGRLGERLTLPQLGRAVGLSGWELARRFRRATGTSIHAYRTRLRVQAVLERVEAGERDLTALALDLGFADHSHMTNVVRRATGAPPSAFRRSDGWTTTWQVRTILQA